MGLLETFWDVARASRPCVAFIAGILPVLWGRCPCVAFIAGTLPVCFRSLRGGCPCYGGRCPCYADDARVLRPSRASCRTLHQSRAGCPCHTAVELLAGIHFTRECLIFLYTSSSDFCVHD